MSPWTRPLRAALLSLAALACAGGALACEKSVRWNEDPPFSMRSNSGSSNGNGGEVVGIHIDVVREALRRLGCSARFEEMPWARALGELEAGRLDILTGALRTPERERFALFSTPGLQSRNMLFVRSDLPRGLRLARLADLQDTGFRLGAQIGVSYGEEYEALMREPEFARHVHRVPARRSLWLMAAAGRIDGVLADEHTAAMELAQLGLLERVRNSGVAIAHPPAATAFSRKSVSAEFVDRYNKALDAMQRDGSLDAIARRYVAAPASAPPGAAP